MILVCGISSLTWLSELECVDYSMIIMGWTTMYSLEYI
jgi:hypothetical protein